jgi:hypothetical protein
MSQLRWQLLERPYRLSMLPGREVATAFPHPQAPLTSSARLHEFQVTAVWLPISIEAVGESRRPMTGSEGRASVEQAGELAGQGYDQLEIGYSSGPSAGSAVRVMPTDDGLRPLTMERNRAHEMKDASARASLGPTVSVAHLAAAITTAASMDIREKERVCDRIYAAQPNLLGSVLVSANSVSRCRRSMSC